MSAYVLTALPAPKRVRAIQPEGQQEEEEENIWAYMQFSDAQMQEQQQQQQAQPEEGAPPDAAPDPEAVTEAFQAAKGELEWLLCTLDRLKAGEVLAVSRCDKEASQKLAELAVAQSLKLARRRSALAAAAEQLRAGAAALSLAVSREDSFYIELARLQRCWKLRMNPPGSEQLFTFDLSLLPPTLAHTPLAAAVAAAGGGGGGADGGWERAAIMRGPLGDLRLQVPAPALPASAALPGSAAAAQPAPRVCVGTREVHSFLLARQRALLWAAARGCIEAEESGGLGPSLGRPDGPGGAGGAASAAAGPGSAAASTARAKRSGDAASAAPGTWQVCGHEGAGSRGCACWGRCLYLCQILRPLSSPLEWFVQPRPLRRLRMPLPPPTPCAGLLPVCLSPPAAAASGRRRRGRRQRRRQWAGRRRRQRCCRQRH